MRYFSSKFHILGWWLPIRVIVEPVIASTLLKAQTSEADGGLAAIRHPFRGLLDVLDTPVPRNLNDSLHIVLISQGYLGRHVGDLAAQCDLLEFRLIAAVVRIFRQSRVHIPAKA
jgi:hypothetical protein